MLEVLEVLKVLEVLAKGQCNDDHHPLSRSRGLSLAEAAGQAQDSARAVDARLPEPGKPVKGLKSRITDAKV